MSANYKEVTAEGTIYTRCNAVVVQNDYQEQPYILFHEQRVMTIGGEQVIQNTSSCRTNFVPEAVVPLIDVATGEMTEETITQADVYRILYSAYMQAALARDAAEGGGQ